MTMSDGTNSKSWQKFIAELKKEDVDFSTICHADESTRAQLLQSLSTLSSIDRAQVSSTWAKLASSGGKSESDSTPSRDPAVPMREATSTTRVPEQQVPFRSSPAANNWQQQQQQQQQSFGRFEESQTYVPPAAPDYGNNTPLGNTNRSASYANRSMSQPQAYAPPPPPVLAVPIMSLGLAGSDIGALLRTALDRGDCGTALPLASEMLQTDPNGLVYLLNEFLPQLTIDQLKVILGVGMPVEGSPVGKEGSGSPQRGMGGLGGNPSKMQSFYSPTNNDDSPGIEMTSQPTMNGQPLSAGQVLTAHIVQSQYGPRFTATCNGLTLKFPYCVQRGDKILVRSAANAERLL